MKTKIKSVEVLRSGRTRRGNTTGHKVAVPLHGNSKTTNLDQVLLLSFGVIDNVGLLAKSCTSVKTEPTMGNTI